MKKLIDGEMCSGVYNLVLMCNCMKNSVFKLIIDEVNMLKLYDNNMYLYVCLKN